MRGSLALTVVLFASALLAAPVPPPGPADPPPGDRPLREEARVFAVQLLRTTDAIAEHYVRPLGREELLRTALAGLYTAARLPTPPSLAADLRDALASKPREASAQEPVLTSELATIPAADLAVIDLIQHIRENIGDPAPLRDREPLVVCFQAVAHHLDSYTAVVGRKELRRSLALDEYTEGRGIELEDGGAGRVVVAAVQPGGPAQKAGVRPGDQITDLDGKAVKDLPRADLLRLLHQPADASDGPPDVVYVDPAPVLPGRPGVAAPEAEPPPPPPVKATVRRDGDPSAKEVVLKYGRFHPEAVLGLARQEDNSWTYWADARAGLAHVRLASLNKGTAEELRRVVGALHDGGLRGLVLDLRWCPGGFLDEAVNAAQIFLDEGATATIRARGKEDQVFRGDGQGALTDFPMVVLVNGETCGGAELIAAALQDRGRAVVAGQRTLGKASVQTQIPLGVPGAALKLTSGVFIRPSGKNLQRNPESRREDDWGVRPDDGLEFRVSPDLGRMLRRDWQRQTLRPGPSAERLPMDDPDADPQRQAALEALRARVKDARQASKH